MLRSRIGETVQLNFGATIREAKAGKHSYLKGSCSQFAAVNMHILEGDWNRAGNGRVQAIIGELLGL